MPTENRSSSNHGTRTFTLDSLTTALEQVQAFHEISADLIADSIFSQPAQQGQGQGEPVAWFKPQWNGQSAEWRPDLTDALFPEMWKARYTHADPAEVERRGPLCFCGLRQTKNPHPEAGVPPGYLDVGTVYDCIPCLNKSRRAWSKRANKAENELSDLRAQLSEAQALLDRVVDHVKFWHDHPYAECLHGVVRDYQALSASAEPSAPVERDELRDLLNSMTCSYRSVVQAGYDRITALGGECDSVEKMLADFPDYAKARAALERKS